MIISVRLATLALIVLTACGENKKDKVEPNAPPFASTPSLFSYSDDSVITSGTWASECRPCGKSFCLDVINTSPSSLIWAESQYEDPLCEEPLMRIRYVSSYEAREGRIIARLRQTDVILKDENLKRVAEQIQSCGFDTWPLHQTLDITGRPCSSSPEEGGVWARWVTPYKSIVRADYKIDGPNLTLKTATEELVFRWTTTR